MVTNPQTQMWHEAPPTHEQSKVDRQFAYTPRFERFRVYPPNALDQPWAFEAEHDPRELYAIKAHVGEGFTKYPQYEFMDIYRDFIDHVRIVASIIYERRLQLCMLVVWSSGEWSWEPVTRFIHNERAYKLWIVDKVLRPYLHSEPRRIAYGVLVGPTVPRFHVGTCLRCNCTRSYQLFTLGAFRSGVYTETWCLLCRDSVRPHYFETPPSP